MRIYGEPAVFQVVSAVIEPDTFVDADTGLEVIKAEMKTKPKKTFLIFHLSKAKKM